MDRTTEAAGIRAQAQQATIFALLKSGTPTAGAAAAWQALTEAAARTLEVAHASVWLLSDDGMRLALADLYDRREGRHRAGQEIEAKGFPAYFQALRWNRAIVAPDAATDPRTAEFAGGYLESRGIVSMLDAGIWQEGQAKGVVCLESVGERRDWTLDEQQFAGSIADIAATVLVHESLRTARARLQESQEIFAGAIRSSPDAVVVVRLTDDRFLLVNRAFERMSGYSEHEAVGRTAIELGLWVDPVRRDAWIGQVRREGSVRDYEVDLRMKDGKVRPFLLSGERVEIGGAPCLILVSRDLTDRKRQETLVSEIAQGVASQTGDSFFRSLVSHLGRALEADLTFVGEVVPGDEARIRTIAVRGPDGMEPEFSYELEGSPCKTILGQGMCVYPCDVATLFPKDLGLARRGIQAYVGAPLNDSRGRPLGLLAVMFRRPIEDSRLVENLIRIFAVRAAGELQRGNDLRDLEHLAHHDPLTGLPNRIRLRQMLEAALPAGEPSRVGRGALLLIDLDRFKEINDTLGHPVGDTLLQRVARILETGMRECCDGDVARLGGDEFAVWIPGMSSTGEAQSVAANARALLTAPVDIEGYRLEIGASVGVAVAPIHAITASGLLRCADVAMYSAKRNGSGSQVYDASQDPYSTERLALLSELGDAVRNGELRVHYQPRVRLADGRVRGFEALVRWQHPRLGLLPPARFVPLAELSDTIRPLTYWVLGEALRQQREWRDGGRDVHIAVNLSARHLMDEGLASRIEGQLGAHGVDATALELEITESAIIADPERAAATLAGIRDLGVHVSVDDFGTGFSSLMHLKRLPLTSLKIDLSFVGQMLASPADRAIVESTIHLAHDLGLAVVAEGIEDEPTFQALRAQGCDEGQGFAISHPMVAAAATAWLAARA